MQKNRKEHLFCNAIHGIIESVDKVKDQKRIVFMEKIDHNAHSVYLMYYHLNMVIISFLVAVGSISITIN